MIISSLKNKLKILFWKIIIQSISLKRIISRVNNYNYYAGFSFRLGKKLKKEYHNADKTIN